MAQQSIISEMSGRWIRSEEAEEREGRKAEVEG
jgi:hypothetical protein